MGKEDQVSDSTDTSSVDSSSIVHVDESVDDADTTTNRTAYTMLTTVDNPWSPFDNFDQWYEYDERMGYHSCSLLARVAVLSNELSDSLYNYELLRAIDEIVSENVTGMFRKVTRDI
jgi:hypothetical protein